jgi:hypothetical protein
LAYSLLRNGVGSLLVAGCLWAGCYTDPVNMPPTVEINQRPQPDRGATVPYTATATDPDDDPVAIAWAAVAGGCPTDPLDPTGWPAASQWTSPQAANQSFTVGAPTTRAPSFCVWAKAIDSWGASAVAALEGQPMDHAPVAALDVVSPANAPSFPLGTSFTLSAARSSDADGDPLQFCWVLKSRPSGVPDFAPCTAETSSPTQTFVASVAGVYDVALQVSDGVDTTTVDTTLMVQPGHVPTPAIALVSPTGAGPFPLGSVFHVSGAHSTVPDPGDVLTCTWEPIDLTGAPGSIATLAPCPDTTNACEQCFTADAPGTYRVTLDAADQTGTAQPVSLSVVVNPDEPPCLGTTDPDFASPLLSQMPADDVLFTVLTVDDDLDPYPNAASLAMQAHFSWFQSANAAVFAPIEDDFPRYEIHPNEFALGDQVRVRLQIRDDDTDRSAKEFLACGDADVCFTGPPSAGCFQRVTWTVSYNR